MGRTALMRVAKLSGNGQYFMADDNEANVDAEIDRKKKHLLMFPKWQALCRKLKAAASPSPPSANFATPASRSKQMIGRIVEVADDRRHLFLSRGFLVVQDTEGERKELGQIPLDDIAAVIANAHGLSYTNNLLVALAERCAPFVLCAANHNAVGMVMTIDGNYQQAKRFDAQIAATQPLIKRLWADIVKSKLQQQAAALEAAGAPYVPLSGLGTQSALRRPGEFRSTRRETVLGAAVRR